MMPINFEIIGRENMEIKIIWNITVFVSDVFLKEGNFNGKKNMDKQRYF